MKKSRIDRSVIHCGIPQDANLAYIAMFRYAFGRMTYMPGVVIDIIKRNGERLTDVCLALLDRDLNDEARRYERVWKDKPTSNYGMKCDRELWLAFHAWVKEEIAKERRPTMAMEANNMAAMREALEELVANIEMRSSTFGLNVMVDTKAFLDAKSALAAPLRNCDVGTAEEQEKRFGKFCDSHKRVDGSTVCSPRCPLYKTPECSLHWAQMPYEEGGAV